jgi:hypothetical protein
MKHTRTIALVPWQEAIALDSFPHLLLRGLIHSDGCRVQNRVRSKRGVAYSYPRYMFTNMSAGIREIFMEACGRLGIACRPSNRHVISVARRDAVAKMDLFIGPKSF